MSSEDIPVPTAPQKSPTLSFFRDRDAIFYVRIIFAILATIYFIYCTFDPGRFRLVDGLFMIVHEVGHIVGSLVSSSVGMVGGTLVEFLFILGILLYFTVRKEYYSAAIVLFFLGRAIDYTSWYIGDAIKMEGTPFIPWPGGKHDWNWMLTQIGQLHNAGLISGIVRGFGFIVTALAIFSSFWFAARRRVVVKWSKNIAAE